MKRNLKTLLASGALALALALTGCQKVTQSLADKINAAAATEKESDDYTYTQLVKKLGDGSGAVVSGVGAVVWTETKGNTTYTLTVTFLGGKAAGAVYAESTKEEK